jgi:hypothetical protein
VQQLLDAVVTFPGAMYTVLLGVVTLYWISMLVGAVDLDLLGGAEHGGTEAAAEGALDGHGAGDGHLDHGGDIDHGGDVDHGEAEVGEAEHGGADHGDDGVLSALGALGLRKLPMTVSVSLLVIWGWLVSVLGALTLAEPASRYLPSGVFRGLLFVVAALSLAEAGEPVGAAHRAALRGQQGLAAGAPRGQARGGVHRPRSTRASGRCWCTTAARGCCSTRATRAATP